jgi:hypothetical protein
MYDKKLKAAQTQVFPLSLPELPFLRLGGFHLSLPKIAYFTFDAFYLSSKHLNPYYPSDVIRYITSGAQYVCIISERGTK